MSRAPSDTCAGNLGDSNSASEVKTDRAAGIWFRYMEGGNLLTVQSMEMMSYFLFFWPLFSAI